jgi:hypothetical protein
MLTYAMDPSMLTPGFTFCAIAVTIEASFATCSRTWSNVSLIKLDSVSSYPSSTGGNVVICSTGEKNMAMRSWLTRDRNVWHFLPHYIFKRPYAIFLKNSIRFHLGEFRQPFWTEPCTDSWIHIPLHPRNELIIFRENCNDGDFSRRIRRQYNYNMVVPASRTFPQFARGFQFQKFLDTSLKYAAAGSWYFKTQPGISSLCGSHIDVERRRLPDGMQLVFNIRHFAPSLDEFLYDFQVFNFPRF